MYLVTSRWIDNNKLKGVEKIGRHEILSNLFGGGGKCKYVVNSITVIEGFRYNMLA